MQLVLNSTVQKSTGVTPLQLLLGIQQSTPLIQSLLTDLAPDLTPVRNRTLDRERVAEALNRGVTELSINKRRRDTITFGIGDFVLMHRDSKMHASKTNYEFMGPYEVLACLPNERYELKKVGSNITTKAAKEQLRRWPTEWSLNCDGEYLTSLFEEGAQVEADLQGN